MRHNVREFDRRSFPFSEPGKSGRFIRWHYPCCWQHPDIGLPANSLVRRAIQALKFYRILDRAMDVSSKYLFVDDRWIDHTHAVHRRAGVFEKHPANPLLIPDQPWEGEGIYCFGTCIEEQARLRLWYQVYVFNSKLVDTRFRTAVGYAESADGLFWEKPLVGVRHPEFGPTNLVSLSSGRSHLCSPAVVRDERESDPNRRYKMLYFDSMAEADLKRFGSPFPTCPTVPGWGGMAGEGLFTLTSPDGIHWQRSPRPIVGLPCDASSLTQLSDGCFLATFKTSNREDRHFRVIAESRSRDFEHWSQPETVLEPDWRDSPGTEFYGLATFEYHGNRLGLLWIYHNSPDDKRMDVQLASWAPSNGWQRAADRSTLLANGKRGEWDAGTIVTSSGLLPIYGPEPEQLWLYYGGGNVRHDDSRYRRNAIGLARLRLDGFASMDAGYFPGELRTKPVNPTSTRLLVNANVSRKGHLRATLLDSATGATLARTHQVSNTDRTKLELAWEEPWRPKSNRPITVVFSMSEASLFSFWFA